MGDFGNFFSNVGNGIADGATVVGNGIADGVVGFGNGVADGATDFGNFWAGVGTDIGQGTWNGMKDIAGGVETAANGTW